jgi:hypothetical protein
LELLSDWAFHRQAAWAFSFSFAKALR